MGYSMKNKDAVFITLLLAAVLFFFQEALLFLLTPFTPYVVHLSLILHCFLAGVFMYLLARNSIENRLACLVAAPCFSSLLNPPARQPQYQSMDALPIPDWCMILKHSAESNF
jgi:hypothetical protein